LEGVGIDSISALAKEDPASLYDKLEQAIREKVLPRKAMIRIWVREAQKRVRADDR
jgi:hypothetical protein